MTPKEEQAVAILREGCGWNEAHKRTGFSEDRLKQLFQQWTEVQQAKVDALAKVAASGER